MVVLFVSELKAATQLADAVLMEGAAAATCERRWLIHEAPMVGKDCMGWLATGWASRGCRCRLCRLTDRRRRRGLKGRRGAGSLIIALLLSMNECRCCESRGANVLEVSD